MKSLSLSIDSKSSAYSIDFFREFSEVFPLLETQINNRNHLFITDENIFEKTDFFENISAEKIIILPAGEQYKNWESITKILDGCFDHQLDRSSVLVAVGGGVIGDMTGFASSIFMRGIPVIQIPTTLLSMVDSSVGGKTGIDTKYGKNLIGAFHQPEKVFCCQQFLESLEFIEIQNGLCEMIKHGILGSEKHFNHLEQFAEKNLEEFLAEKNSENMRSDVFSLVLESVTIKKNIVEQDEKERGVRGFLNLGHTYGHAIELLSEFTIPHGIGVAKGIWMSVLESEKRDMLEDDSIKKRITNIFSQLNISLHHSFHHNEIEKAMIHDKKKKNGVIRLILIKKIGEVEYGEL